MPGSVLVDAAVHTIADSGLLTVDWLMKTRNREVFNQPSEISPVAKSTSA